MKDANTEYTQNGVIGAIYHFCFEYLRQKGCDTVNLGRSRSFLNDGVLKYKRKWGMKVVSSSDTSFLLGVSSLTEGVKGFLSNNPFVYIDKTGLNAAIFLEPGKMSLHDEVRHAFRSYYTEGVSKIVLYYFGEAPPVTTHVIPDELSDRITVSSASRILLT